MTEFAPDGSAVQVLARSVRASMVRCTLAPASVSRAVIHKSVEEMWYCTRGRGRLWRAGPNGASIVALEPGTAASIPLGERFQFRNDGEEALEIIIVTVPPWPGNDEALRVADHWPPTC